jgi:hypothetical protein
LLAACREKTPLRQAEYFSSGTSTGTLQGDFLQEASGLASSRSYPGILWSHNDSGNGPKLFAIDTAGRLVRSYTVPGASNVDWEDLCIGYDSTAGSDFIFIGDIGDNFSRRAVKRVYRLHEPDPFDSVAPLAPAEVITFRLEDGARDMETLMFDPATSSLVLVSKREKEVGVYVIPSHPVQDTVTALRRATLALSGIVGGDISPNGSEIFLKSITTVYYWKRSQGESLTDALMRTPLELSYAEEPQGESIAWSRDAYYTLSEKAGLAPQRVYRYARLPEATPPQQ